MHSASLQAISLRMKNFEPWAEDAAEAIARADHTCALDVADAGQHTLAEIGEVLGITRERVRQIEHIALDKLRRAGGTAKDLREAARGRRDLLEADMAGPSSTNETKPLGGRIVAPEQWTLDPLSGRLKRG